MDTGTTIPLRKVCFKCGQEKPITEFYKHPRMADGHVNKCKVCNKLDVKTNYADRREQYAEYEKQRYQRPERRNACPHATEHKQNHKTMGKEPCTCEGNCYLADDPNAENRLVRCKCVEV